MNIVKDLIPQDKAPWIVLTHESKIISIKYPYIVTSEKFSSAHFLAFKRSIDIIGALLILFLSLPICFVLTILIKLSSPGPIFYVQTRIGKNNKPFQLYKFRSMYINSENGFPMCASKNDPRITSIGKWMRNTHFDEVPNLINVLKGDMSLVGPRPEREYFIDKILYKAPQFTNLLTIKPGVTSWGQVKFGYAHNVNEMVKRMFFDLEYLNDISLKTDLIILLLTFWVVVKGKGIGD